MKVVKPKAVIKTVASSLFRQFPGYLDSILKRPSFIKIYKKTVKNY